MVVGAMYAALGFAIAAVVFVSLLVVASIAVSSLSTHALGPIRMTGPAVRRWSGYVLMAVGLWFIALAFLADPTLVASA